MFVLKTLMFCAAWVAVSCQDRYAPSTTPVPILKQINKQNDDGSYSFGYEAADGSFKIETKYPNGDVAGKYGYVDEGGKLREVSYGASSKRGFQPEGHGIMVPPPTLNDPPSNALSDGEEDDGQYREDPSIYEDPKYNGRTHSRTTQYFKQHSEPDQPTQINSRPTLYTKATQSNYQSIQPAARYQSLQPVQSQQTQYKTPLYTQESTLLNQAPQQFNQQDYRPQSQVYHQQPQFSYQGYTQQPNTYQNQQYQNPQYQNQQYQNPQYQNPQYQNQQYQNQQYQNQNYNPFAGHPAQSFDPVTGSYTINFTGR